MGTTTGVGHEYDFMIMGRSRDEMGLCSKSQVAEQQRLDSLRRSIGISPLLSLRLTTVFTRCHFLLSAYLVCQSVVLGACAGLWPNKGNDSDGQACWRGRFRTACRFWGSTWERWMVSDAAVSNRRKIIIPLYSEEMDTVPPRSKTVESQRHSPNQDCGRGRGCGCLG